MTATPEQLVHYAALGVEAAEFAEMKRDADLFGIDENSCDSDGWVSVDDRLPKIGEWCAVFIDLRTGDWFDQQTIPVTIITAASLRSIDSEGYADWQQGQLSSGHPLRKFSHVTYWMPLPKAPIGIHP
ncbi:DUF551 domain-containing protein [Collimonas arenae]|uniref:DUF551 domain-containing protein n=1 Tax=Collimonas arenae TaxID=279058 RepID=UPI0005718BA9|nr:DUF551 domain-containing protein [Collimonas arenae]